MLYEAYKDRYSGSDALTIHHGCVVKGCMHYHMKLSTLQKINSNL